MSYLFSEAHAKLYFKSDGDCGSDVQFSKWEQRREGVASSALDRENTEARFTKLSS